MVSMGDCSESDGDDDDDVEEEEEEAEEEEEDKDPARQILTISSLGYTNIVIYLYA